MLPPPTSATVAVPVPDLAAAVEWYSALLGRTPEIEPADGIAEWELLPTLWLQLAESEGHGTDGGQLLRLGVAVLDTAVQALRAAGAEIVEEGSVPGVIAWCDVADPWGNRLSVYEVLGDG